MLVQWIKHIKAFVQELAVMHVSPQLPHGAAANEIKTLSDKSLKQAVSDQRYVQLGKNEIVGSVYARIEAHARQTGKPVGPIFVAKGTGGAREEPPHFLKTAEGHDYVLIHDGQHLWDKKYLLPSMTVFEEHCLKEINKIAPDQAAIRRTDKFREFWKGYKALAKKAGLGTLPKFYVNDGKAGFADAQDVSSYITQTHGEAAYIVMGKQTYDEFNVKQLLQTVAHEDTHLLNLDPTMKEMIRAHNLHYNEPGYAMKKELRADTGGVELTHDPRTAAEALIIQRNAAWKLFLSKVEGMHLPMARLQEAFNERQVDHIHPDINKRIQNFYEVAHVDIHTHPPRVPMLVPSVVPPEKKSHGK